MSQQLRVGICSTYAPRACGLATFAADLARSVRACHGVASVGIIAMVDSDEVRSPSPADIVAKIDQRDPRSYALAAEIANAAFDVVVVQHEFGIFGGRDGEFLLRFMTALRIPVIVTMHTVLPAFSLHQAEVLRSACRLADAVTVFTPTAVDLLLAQEIVSARKVHVIPHGAPAELYGCNRHEARKRLGLHDEFVVSTFGLVSPGKGLELAIDALAAVVVEKPDTVLIIAGRTHPGVHRRDGESYRQGLVAQVTAAGLQRNVRFIDEFLPIDRIAEILAATDTFITPYINAEQIVSGALTFALAAGTPVVSTRYRYAIDQLSSGAGIIVDNREPAAIAEAILLFASNRELRSSAAAEATRIGDNMRWTVIGQRMTELIAHQESARSRTHAENFDKVIDIGHHRTAASIGVLPPALRVLPPGAFTAKHSTVSPAGATKRPASAHAPLRLPVENPATGPSNPVHHLLRLIDDTGIIQHATGRVPRRSTGYCVDDVARLLPLAQVQSDSVNSFRASAGHDWDIIASRATSFLLDAAEESTPTELKGRRIRQGSMRNFMRYDRQWDDEPHFGDHVGRAAMGLAAAAKNPHHAPGCIEVLTSVFNGVQASDPLHLRAYVLLAQVAAPEIASQAQIVHLADSLALDLASHRRDGWEWFEPTVRYDAALIPMALLRAGSHLGDDQIVDAGLRSLEWLRKECDNGEWYRFPGHRSLTPGTHIDDSGDEQPLEARAFVEALAEAYHLTGDDHYRVHALECFAWFHGRNRLGVALVGDDGGCYDGLGENEPNNNCGAESTLAYVSAFHTIRPLFTAARTTKAASATTPSTPGPLAVVRIGAGI